MCVCVCVLPQNLVANVTISVGVESREAYGVRLSVFRVLWVLGSESVPRQVCSAEASNLRVFKPEVDAFHL